ncbi:MAG: 2-hydroxychromene-2-carboxylate isomerase [Nevskia sp.]|nr:2-hydroxychromene-2-carboxylate isomerase [Nevskia sp.]
MRAARWYFDVVSPFAYLQLAGLKRFEGRLQIEYCPVLFAGLLKHWGQLGPAEIPAKRLQIYRMCTFLARSRGIPFRMPPRHPFNPLPALRLIVALDAQPAVIADVFDFIFAEGRDIGDPAELEALARRLGVADLAAATGSAQVKQRLADNTNAAIAEGVFGVPTMVCEGELFWGDDSSDMLDAFLRDRHLFEDPEMQRLTDLPVGQARRLDAPAR